MRRGVKGGGGVLARLWTVEGRRRVVRKDDRGEGKGGRVWWDRQREGRKDQIGETGRLSHIPVVQIYSSLGS